jgi:chromate transport protein ChrA
LSKEGDGVSSAPAKPTRTLSGASKQPSLLTLARIAARTGVGTFGSGNLTSILLGRELEERGWFGRAQFDLCFTIARAVPGTNLLACVAAIGWYVRGWPGAIVFVVALSVPASVAVILLTLGYQTWHAHPVGKPAIEAAMSSIVGVIAASSWFLIRAQPRSVRTGAMVLGALALSPYLAPISVMVLAALAGYYWQERQ